MQTSIRKLQSSFYEDLEKVNSETKLEDLKLKYLSKKHGLTIVLMQNLPSLSATDKKKLGPLLNSLKNQQIHEISSKRTVLAAKRDKQNSLDLTIPVDPIPAGHLHPTTVVIREMNEFFRSQGFSIGEGPEIETSEYNFHKLNLPDGHPATDLQDTLFIEEPSLLLRTHTSSIETRIMTDNKPPLRVASPGKVYRNETINATNSSFFHHYQGFVVDKGVNIQHLKDILTKFHQFLFGKDVVLRFRYKYYPEVSPGTGVDMQCLFCKGKGCTVCKHRGFIEVLGSGMIHYNTIKACGIDPDVYTGYAFGMGLDRLVMNKFKIDDIRKLYGGELVYN